MKRITLKVGHAIEVEGVRVVVLRLNGDGSALLGVVTTATVTIDKARETYKPLRLRPSPKTR